MAYHGGDRLAAFAHGHTPTAVARGVPVRVRQRRPLQARREGVGREAAGAALHVTAVKGRLAGEGPAHDGAFVERHGSCDGGVCGRGQSEERKDGGGHFGWTGLLFGEGVTAVSGGMEMNDWAKRKSKQSTLAMGKMLKFGHGASLMIVLVETRI